MQNIYTIKILLLTSLFLLTQCEWIDGIGRHFPVIGERCEYWQCFTESGRQKSDEKKKKLLEQQKQQCFKGEDIK